jgi:hypothetical protein
MEGNILHDAGVSITVLFLSVESRSTHFVLFTRVSEKCPVSSVVFVGVFPVLSFPLTFISFMESVVTHLPPAVLIGFNVYFIHGKCCHSLVTCCLDWFERFQVGSLARISWDLENDIPWEGKKENWNRFSSKCTGHWLFVHGTNCVLYSWFVTSCLAFSFSLLLLFVQKEKVQVHDVCFVMDSYLRVSNSPAGRDKIFRWVWHSFFPLNLNHKLSKSGENNHESFPRLNTLHPWNTLYMLRFVVSFVPPQVHSVHVQVSALVAWRWSEECSVTGSPNTSAGSSHESFAKRFVDYRQVV